MAETYYILPTIIESSDSASASDTDTAIRLTKTELSRLSTMLVSQQTERSKSLISSQKQALSFARKRWADRAGLKDGSRDWTLAAERYSEATKLVLARKRAFNCLPLEDTMELRSTNFEPSYVVSCADRYRFGASIAEEACLEKRRESARPSKEQS